MYRYTIIFLLTLCSPAVNADTITAQLQNLSPEQRGLFIHLRQLQQDNNWATGVISIPSGLGPAWAMIDVHNGQYRYLGCPSRGVETHPVESVSTDKDTLSITYLTINGQRLDHNSKSQQTISRNEWTQKTSAISIQELLYIAQRCEFQSGLDYWKALEHHNKNIINKMDLEKISVQSLLGSAELFQFQPKIESMTVLHSQQQQNTQTVLFSVELTGNNRSGYCGSHTDQGFFIANFIKNNQSSLWQYHNGRLIADNHCISSRRYHYIEYSLSGYVIERHTDHDNTVKPSKECLLIDSSLTLKSCRDD